MASFDLVNAAGHAYIRTWEERAYIFRLALVPLLVKFILYSISVFYFDADSIIRLSLIMLPAYLAEGWALAHWTRTIMLDHRWPFVPSGEEDKDRREIKKRARGIMGGAVAFTLINILMAGYFALFMFYIPADIDPQKADPKLAVIGVIMIISLFLLFRFVWLYVPIAANIPLRVIVQKLKPASITFSMIGLWLVCFIPAAMILQAVGGLLQSVAGDEPIAMMQGLMLFSRVFIDTVKNFLCTAGMAYAFIALMGYKKQL
jgi:hypothetical protein